MLPTSVDQCACNSNPLMGESCDVFNEPPTSDDVDVVGHLTECDTPPFFVSYQNGLLILL